MRSKRVVLLSLLALLIPFATAWGDVVQEIRQTLTEVSTALEEFRTDFEKVEKASIEHSADLRDLKSSSVDYQVAVDNWMAQATREIESAQKKADMANVVAWAAALEAILVTIITAVIVFRSGG